tara:strand:- start:700 stop:927 length:228 start_codon:yes stop_codon:yes gene_type:complete
MYIWILTVMLSYGSIVDIKTLEHDTEIGTLHFKTLEACEDYIYKNKVVVVKDLLQHFDNGQLTGFDFMCESQWYD